MVVALGARHGQPEPHSSGGVDAIDDPLEAIFLNRVGLALGLGSQPMKHRGDLLGRRGVGKHVAGELLYRELIERLVAGDGSHDPIAVGPVVIGLVVGIPPRICIAGQIEPVLRPSLGVIGRRHEPINQPLVGIPRRIGDKGGDRGWAGGKPGEIKTHPPQQRVPLGLRSWGQTLGLQGREHEGVDRIAWPCRQNRQRHLRPARRHQRPVGLVLSPLFDPGMQNRTLRGSELLVA